MASRRPLAPAPPSLPTYVALLTTLLLLVGTASSGPVAQTSLALSTSTVSPSQSLRIRTTNHAVQPVTKKRVKLKWQRAAAGRKRGEDDDDDDDGPLGLGSLPGLGSLQGLSSKLSVGSIGPMSLLPALLPLGMLPTSLAQLAAAVLAASTLGQFALGRALMQLVRDFVFGPRPGPHVVYTNKGWEPHRMPHAPPPVVQKIPPEVQLLLTSAAFANLPMKPGTHPKVKMVPSHEVPEPPYSLHSIYKPHHTHEILHLPPGLKLAQYNHPKIPPSYKAPYPFPHQNAPVPSEQSLLPGHSQTKNLPEATHNVEENVENSQPIYEFPTDDHGQLNPPREPAKNRIPLAYSGRPIPPPAPVTEEAERRWPSSALSRHHAELLRLPHPHPAILPEVPPSAPHLSDYHVVKYIGDE